MCFHCVAMDPCRHINAIKCVVYPYGKVLSNLSSIATIATSYDTKIYSHNIIRSYTYQEWRWYSYSYIKQDIDKQVTKMVWNVEDVHACMPFNISKCKSLHMESYWFIHCKLKLSVHTTLMVCSLHVGVLLNHNLFLLGDKHSHMQYHITHH